MNSLDKDEIKTALSYISSDCSRDEWFKILCSVHSALGQNGYQLALDWSKQSSKFNQKNFDATWSSIKPGVITKATLFEQAYRNGMPRPVKSDFPTKKEPVLSHSKSDSSGFSAHTPNQFITNTQSVQNSPNEDAKKQANVLKQWNSLKPFKGHEYLEKKQLTGKLNGYESNLRCGFSKNPMLNGSFFAYPILDLETKSLTGFTRISLNSKMLAKDSIKSRNAAIIGNLDQDTHVVCICEGFADGMHIHNATKYTTLVANDAGNVPSVAKRVRQLYPRCQIVVCPDNDDAGRASVAKTRKLLRNQNVAVVFPTKKDFSDDVLAGVDIAKSFSGIQQKESVLAAKKSKEDEWLKELTEMGFNPTISSSESLPNLALMSSQEINQIDKVFESITTRSSKEVSGPVKERANSIPGLKFIPDENLDAVSLIHSSPNLAKILDGDRDWQGVLKRNLFTEKIEKVIAPSTGTGVGEWTDIDDVCVKDWVDRIFDNVFSVNDITEAVKIVGVKNEYHPVRDYLNQLKWDGTQRVETFFSVFFGVENTEYTRFVAMSMFVSAVARVFEPGCKVDTIVILEGSQGMGKSATIRALCPNDDWFCDSSIDMNSKDAYLALRGRWLIEFAELDSLSKAESTRAKSFISSAIDTYREPYGRYTLQHPRHCILIGTTNHDTYLKDETGNRRYLPVKCLAKSVDIPAIVEIRDQLWAEATQMYRNGVKWHWDRNSALAKTIAEQQENRLEVDIWHDAVEKFCTDRTEVTVTDIAITCLGIEIGKLDQRVKNRIAKILTILGFSQKRIRVAHKMQRVYQRNPVVTEQTVTEHDVLPRKILDALNDGDALIFALATVCQTTPEEMLDACLSLETQGFIEFLSSEKNTYSVVTKPY
jgi:predicted P-loop ATPase